MSNPFNNGTLIGRLCAEPELRYTTEKVAVASFRLAVPDNFKKDITHFFDCVAWRQQAEFMANYCGKGDRVACAFHLKVEEWDDKDGNKRSKVKVECDAVTNLSPKKDDEDEKPRKSSGDKKKSSRDDEDEKPKKKARRDEDEDDEDEKPRKKSRRDDDDDEDEKPKKKARRSSDDDDDDTTYESV